MRSLKGRGESMAIGIIPNLGKSESMEVASQLLGQLQEAGEEVWLEGKAASHLGEVDHPFSTWGGNVRLAIVLGGDGTLLSAGRKLLGQNVPLVGVNMGRLGFLTELELEELPQYLPELLAGNYKVERRMALSAKVHRDSRQVAKMLAINDVVIARGAFARIINLETKISGEYVATYPADGIIIANSTGSTAYSLSAGGPLVNPRLEAIVLTPICAHTLYSRSIVISSTDVVEVAVRAGRESTMLSVDGQEGFALANNDLVEVEKADASLPLVYLGCRSFYHRLRTRLSEGRL
jgi:NAD+ kinase